MTIINQELTGSLESAKAAIHERVGEWKDRLLDLSHDIHSHPETAFNEHHAAAAVANTLVEAGFDAKVGAFGLETAVEATYGTGDFTVAVCAEYDALPGIGHACGHNIIAAAGVGTAIALSSIAEEAGIRVKLLGTPAEESGGGKALMLEAGAWEDATISLMVHGGPAVDIRCSDGKSQAVDRFDVIYTGRPAHAAAAPHAGINAADAATLALVGIGLLRQQLRGTVRVSAVVAEGGEVTNVIPARTVVKVEVRSFDIDELDDAKQRVLACFEAGAVASGCEWEYNRVQPRYANLVQDPFLSASWDEALAGLGRQTVPMPNIMGGSTDMGNVSHVVPSIHPGIGIKGSDAPPHTVEFAAAAATPAADQAVLDSTIGMALAAAAAALNPAARQDFLRRQRERTPGATTVSQDGD